MVTEQRETERVQYWQWRLHMAERVAADLDPERFGVVIDLLIHVRGSDEQRLALINWMEGWGKCLSELNYLRTGYRTENLLDVHLVTDKDIANKDSYATKIGAVTNAARELELLRPDRPGQ